MASTSDNGTNSSQIHKLISATNTVVQLLLCIVGLVLYGLVCWIILKHRKTAFANSFYTLTLALAVPDCLHLITEIFCALPMSFIGYHDDSYLFMAVCGFFADAAYWSLAPLTVVISVNRYVAVCHFQVYKQLFSPKNVIAMVIGCWALGLFLPTFMYSCTCIYLFKDHLWKFYCDGSCENAAMLTNMTLASSLTIAVAVIYALIFVQYKIKQRQISKTVQLKRVENGSNSTDRTHKKEAALMFQFAFISFVLIFYIATFWIVSLFVNNSYGDMFCNFCVNLNSCSSPILYLSFGSEFRKRLPWKKNNVLPTMTLASKTEQNSHSPNVDRNILVMQSISSKVIDNDTSPRTPRTFIT